MKNVIILTTVLTCSFATVAQAQIKYTTRNVFLAFNPTKDSNKDYSAQSKEGTAVLKVATGDVALLVPMKTFHFNNALLEEHFNENYLESNKFPNAKYAGKLVGFTPDMLKQDGTYNISSEGTVDLHGVQKPFKAAVALKVTRKKVVFVCHFTIKAEEHKIEIPGIVKPKLADATPIDATITFDIK